MTEPHRQLGFAQKSVVEPTPKEFANSSPGFALKPWVLNRLYWARRNSERVATATAIASIERQRNPFRVALVKNETCFPGLPKRNPGLEFANSFGVKNLPPLLF